MDKTKAESVLKKALGFSEADECEVSIGGGGYSLTRFANNIIHQNVNEQRYQLSVRSVFGKRTGRAITNKLGDRNVEAAVRLSESVARVQPEIPELLAVPGPQEYVRVDSFDDSTAGLAPAIRAEAV
ncbi:MAG: TldD/PmbA family protein, partial [Candidatus Eisenbacteria bacterium]